MKTCTKCKQIKSLDEFHLRKAGKDGRHCYCKQCAIKGAKKSYRDLNQKDKIIKSSEKRLKFFRELINNIKIKYSCCCCGEKTPECLDFHHKDPNNKNGNVASFVSQKSIKKIINEINKCIVVCANCHRKIHANLIDVSNKQLCNENLELIKVKLPENNKPIVKHRRKNKNCIDCNCSIWKNSIRCVQCSNKKNNFRKVKNRPSIEQLKKEIEETNYCAVGRKYGVSDKAVRKWINPSVAQR